MPMEFLATSVLPAAELRPSDLTAWHTLRQALDYRHEGRRNQFRFRRDP
jgi:hypothetical protein